MMKKLLLILIVGFILSACTCPTDAAGQTEEEIQIEFNKVYEVRESSWGKPHFHVRRFTFPDGVECVTFSGEGISCNWSNVKKQEKQTGLIYD